MYIARTRKRRRAFVWTAGSLLVLFGLLRTIKKSLATGFFASLDRMFGPGEEPSGSALICCKRSCNAFADAPQNTSCTFRAVFLRHSPKCWQPLRATGDPGKSPSPASIGSKHFQAACGAGPSLVRSSCIHAAKSRLVPVGHHFPGINERREAGLDLLVGILHARLQGLVHGFLEAPQKFFLL